MSSPKITLHLTEAEANALYGAAKAGEYEWVDVTQRAPDLTPQGRAAAVAALGRALAKLRAA